MAYETGKRIVEMAHEDLRPSRISPAPFPERHRSVGASAVHQCAPHLIAMARHAGVDLCSRTGAAAADDIPLLVNMQPAGKYLGERFHLAGGVPAVMGELLEAGRSTRG